MRAGRGEKGEEVCGGGLHGIGRRAEGKLKKESMGY